MWPFKQKETEFGDLEKHFKTKNGVLIDFEQINKEGLTPAKFAFLYCETMNFNLNKNNVDKLIKNENLKTQTGINGVQRNLFFLAMENNNILNLDTEQWEYLINNSHTELKGTNRSISAFDLYHIYKEDNYLNFSYDQINLFYERKIKLKNAGFILGDYKSNDVDNFLEKRKSMIEKQKLDFEIEINNKIEFLKSKNKL